MRTSDNYAVSRSDTRSRQKQARRERSDTKQSLSLQAVRYEGLRRPGVNLWDYRSMLARRVCSDNGESGMFLIDPVAHQPAKKPSLPHGCQGRGTERSKI